MKLTTINQEQPSLIMPEGDDYQNNIWTREAKDRLNIEYTTEWISAEYETQLNLAIASQSLPDFFLVKDAQFKQLLTANMLADIGKAHDAISSDTLRKLNNDDPSVLDSCRRDGGLYGQPMLDYGRICLLGYMWFRGNIDDFRGSIVDALNAANEYDRETGINILSNLAGYDFGEVDGASINKALNALTNYDYDGALAILCEI